MQRFLCSLTAVLVASVPGAITFDSSFESGNGTNFIQTAPGEFAFEIEPDTNSSDRQWFQFDVSGAQGQTLTFHLQGIDQTNVPGHWSLARPIASSDGSATWEPVTGTPMNTSTVYTFSHAITGDPERIAFHYPYTHTRHTERVAEWGADPSVETSVLGQSVQGRNIDLLRITDPDFEPEGGKIGIWIVARQHAAEVTGSWMADGLIDFLLSSDPRAATLRRYAVVNIVPMMNPDGVVAGNYRDNFNGVNLNREWNQSTMSDSPEVRLVVDAIETWVTGGNRYDFFADLHSTSGGTTNFAFHASPSIQPPLYPDPASYAADSDEFLQRVQANAGDFRWDTGNSSSTEQRLSRQHQTFQHGVLAVLFEGTYNHTDYGPNSGEQMTPARHRQIGEAFGVALHDHFLSGVPATLTGISIN